MTQGNFEKSAQTEWLEKLDEVAGRRPVKLLSLNFLVNGYYNSLDVVELLEGTGLALTDIDLIIPLSLTKIAEEPHSGEA